MESLWKAPAATDSHPHTNKNTWACVLSPLPPFMWNGSLPVDKSIGSALWTPTCDNKRLRRQPTAWNVLLPSSWRQEHVSRRWKWVSEAQTWAPTARKNEWKALKRRRRDTWGAELRPGEDQARPHWKWHSGRSKTDRSILLTSCLFVFQSLSQLTMGHGRSDRTSTRRVCCVLNH